MKVTLESTNHEGDYPKAIVTISEESNDLDEQEALDMMKRALVAWGYSYRNIFEESDRIKELEGEILRLSGNRTQKP